MNKRNMAMLLTAAALMAGTAGLLGEIRGRQRLGLPGVKTHPAADSGKLEVELPVRVMDYESRLMDIGDVTVKALPADTSYGYRRYHAPDSFEVDLRVVLMGSDRTSLHKPQFCLTGQGWQIDQTIETTFPVERPFKYDLPIIELIATRTENGHRTAERAIYIYWYIADNGLSASAIGLGRMWSMAEQLIRTGTLQRWAYVSCFAACAPGQEQATVERIKTFIAASVPDFQLYPRASSSAKITSE